MLGGGRREGGVLAMAKIVPLYRTSDSAWFDIEDQATPYLQYLNRTFPREMTAALKSLGWYLREKIKKGIETSNPGGRRLPPLSLIQRIRLLDSIKTSKKRKTPFKAAKGSGPGRPGRLYSMTMAKPMGGASDVPYGRKLGRAVRYNYDAAGRSVHIGWITPTASSYARALGQGMRGARMSWRSGPQTVTARMSKLFAAAGIFVRPGKQLKTPARPVVGPVFDKHKAEIPAYLERKVSEWLKKSLTRSLTHHTAKTVMGNRAYSRFARYAA